MGTAAAFQQKRKLVLRGLQFAAAGAVLTAAVYQAVYFVSASAAQPAAGVAAAAKPNPNLEKCYGVVKAYKNDCASKAHHHTCAGQAQQQADPDEYVEVPTGLCQRLNGSAKQPRNPGS